MTDTLYFQELLSRVEVPSEHASDVRDAVLDARDAAHGAIDSLSMFMQFASNPQGGVPTTLSYQEAAWSLQVLNDLVKGLTELERKVEAKDRQEIASQRNEAEKRA